jgi:hypothetical protein
MAQLINEAKRMQFLAGLITESQMNGEENLDEGFKDWLIGLGLTAATILGGVKVYQLDQKQQADKKAQVEYFSKKLTPVIDKMDDEKKSDLGTQINDITKKLSVASNSQMSAEDYSKALSNYAESYMESHPNEFSIGEDGLIYWNKAKENPYK